MVPYDVIAIEADRLIVRMALSPDYDLSYYFYSKYVLLITACGWTEIEFDREMLKRIDRSWDTIKFKLLN